MGPINNMTIEFESKSINESLARVVSASFIAQIDPTIEEIADVKTAVSEAVTNAIIHGYENKKGIVKMQCKLFRHSVEILITDNGVGIEDIEKAREPLYTSKPEIERSGMGFTVMESFMDYIEVNSSMGNGTSILMYKKFRSIS